MRTYEAVVVIDSLLKSEEIDAVIEKVTRIINNNGGTIKNVEHWGKKRLAYEIKKRQYGYYVEMIFEGPGNIIKTLEREFRLDENILRYLSLLLDRKALKFLEDQKDRQLKNKENEKEDNDKKTDEKDDGKEVVAAVEQNDQTEDTSSEKKADAE